MEIYTDTTGTVDAFNALVQRALKSENAKALLVLSCDGNEYTASSLDPILTNIPIPVFGGIFPIVLHDRIQMEKGSVVVAVNHPSEIHYIPGMSDPDVDYEDILETKISEDDDFNTLILFVDGLSTRIGAFIHALYSEFGLEVNYVGGGAGSLSFEQKPCIITSDGLKADGGVIAAFSMESGIGVSHGWETVSGPYKVTEAEKNIVKALDWQPAFDIYRQAVETHSKKPVELDSFFDTAKAYPFGIARIESERVVRDILTVNDDGHLACVAEVPEGEYVDILHGDSDTLIKAAGQAYEKAKKDFQSDKKSVELFMDCISRVLFLQDQFSDEIESIIDDDIPMIGACTIGEIANSGKDYLEFYNKTSVVAFLEQE